MNKTKQFLFKENELYEVLVSEKENIMEMTKRVRKIINEKQMVDQDLNELIEMLENLFFDDSVILVAKCTPNKK
jgi:hypothetical protein